MRNVYGVMLVGATLLMSAASVSAEELVIFDFEGGNLQDWVIPEWATTSTDYVGKELSPSADFVSSGSGSMQLMVDFPGGKAWRGAYAEIMMYVTDWSPFDSIKVDVYLPYTAPKGLKTRVILTVGEQWTWTEMNRAVPLVPDQWTTISANLRPGSLDWKFFPDESFRKDIRKVGIRIESDGVTYRGPIYIDNVQLIQSSQ